VVVETTVPLLGGAMLTTRASGDVWSYPNVHGDVVATANAAGAKVGATLTYDPHGQPLGGLPDNSAGSLDYGWLGRHQRPVETQAGIATIEMGARPYVPGLGRFTEVDPVEGGQRERLHVPSGPGKPVGLGRAAGMLEEEGQVEVRRRSGRGVHQVLQRPTDVRSTPMAFDCRFERSREPTGPC
jgi:hypothetical protein